MRHILQNVMPVGTPWGGPESIRYLSAFVSMRMQIEGESGDAKALQARHEWWYHLYLTVSGIGVSTCWSEGLLSCSHDEMVGTLFPDTIARTMGYAGYTYRIVERDEWLGDSDAVRRRVVASIDKGVPVLACSAAGAEWSVIAGYDDDGGTLIGWDGAQGYWGPPASEPDGYLENRMFHTARWRDQFARLVIVEGATTPRASSRDVLCYLVSVMEEQRGRGLDREFRELLDDDAHFRACDAAALRRAHDYANAYVGFYAEARCFVSFACTEAFPTLPDVRNDRVVESLRKAGQYLSESHDLCWDAWKALRVKHRCDTSQSPEETRCHQCGACLCPVSDEDYEAFRDPGRRQRIAAYVDALAANDAAVLAELRKCVELLSQQPGSR